MRILSWNVNGLRACIKKGFLDWLGTCEGDVVGLQEVRALPEQLPLDAFRELGWHMHWNPAERKGYSGVGILSREAPSQVSTSLGVPEFDCEGRLQIAHFGEIVVANVYFPNGSGKNRDNSRIPFKLDFYRRLFDELEPLRRDGRSVFVIGDFNTAHREIDLARPKQNTQTSGFCAEERDELDRWLSHGWTDTYRDQFPEAHTYTWWSQRRGVREKNIGWRIDYVLASGAAMNAVKDAYIWTEDRGSDHCPIGVDLSF